MARIGSDGRVSPGQTAGGSGTPSPAGPVSPADQSAKALIEATLRAYGLESLADWAWQQYVGGAATEQILLDMRQRPEYKRRFPAMDALAQVGRAITEAQYIQAETSYSQIMHAAGLPAGFYDQPDDFTKFLTGNVSPAELQARVQDAQTVIYGNPEIQHQLQGLYGAGASPGQVLAFFLDPDRAEPLIAKQVAAAQAASYGVQSGFGQLSRSEAEFVAEQNLSPADMLSRFQKIGLQSGLYTRQIGPHADGHDEVVSTHDALAAAFAGDADAQRRILQEAAQRKADQQGAVGFVEDKPGAGYTGLGAAPTT
jgi:hypothetical protein